MKVLQLTQRFSPALGGVEDHVYRLTLKLQQGGVDVGVATTDLMRDIPFSRMQSEPVNFPFPVRRFHALKLAAAPHGLGIVAPGMLLDAMSRDVDLVHAHAYGYFPTWVGSLVQGLGGAPLVITAHSDPGRRNFSKRLFDRSVPRYTLRRATRVIALTTAEARYLESIGVDRERIEVIPNGVDLAEFQGIEERRRAPDGATGLFVGRMYPEQKGLDPLVRGFASLPSKLGVKLRFVGEDWGGVALVRSLGEKLGVAERIEVVGRVSREELLREYARADFLILPSFFEPFGIVLLEAMAAGLPVIASRVGGIPEIVEEDESGILVEPGDSVGLAHAIERLVVEPSLRSRMGKRGAERVTRFSWQSLLPRIMKLYGEAIAERAS